MTCPVFNFTFNFGAGQDSAKDSDFKWITDEEWDSWNGQKPPPVRHVCYICQSKCKGYICGKCWDKTREPDKDQPPASSSSASTSKEASKDTSKDTASSSCTASASKDASKDTSTNSDSTPPGPPANGEQHTN